MCEFHIFCVFFSLFVRGAGGTGEGCLCVWGNTRPTLFEGLICVCVSAPIERVFFVFLVFPTPFRLPCLCSFFLKKSEQSRKRRGLGGMCVCMRSDRVRQPAS